jgi:bifunctional non-homologous end joining protein LigD
MPTRTCIALPRVEPIVPTMRPQPFNDPGWLFEPKYDGFRGLLYLSRDSCNLYSKRGNRMTSFQVLADQLRLELGRRELILDGEIIALDDEGRIDFWGLMRGRGVLAYAAFDVLWLNGRDLRTAPLSRRKRRLEQLIPSSTGALNRIPCFEAEGSELFEAACRLDLEGIVAKRKADTYCTETRWYKIKNPTYTQAEGRRELFERHLG